VEGFININNVAMGMNEHDARRLDYLLDLAEHGPMSYGAFLEYISEKNGTQLDVLMLGRMGCIETDGPELCSVTPDGTILEVTEKGRYVLEQGSF
jgi:hypothetical protein